jgi:hypothetical protein
VKNLQPLTLLVALTLPGCMVLGSTAAMSSACSFEQVWDASIVALADIQLQTANKTAGILETAWVEVEATTRAGAFQRDVNKERLKYVVEITRDGTGTAATVTQLREEFSPMGVRSRQWRAVTPNPSEEASVVSEISRRLKEKGC